MNDGEGRFANMLGLAVIDHWTDLPRKVQHELFERAVIRGHRDEHDEGLREQLAQFLHAKNERTLVR